MKNIALLALALKLGFLVRYFWKDFEKSEKDGTPSPREARKDALRDDDS